MKYRIWFSSTACADPPRDGYADAPSWKQALKIARSTIGVSRLYRGAAWICDTEDGAANAVDFWISARDAKREMNVCADCVIATAPTTKTDERTQS